MSVGDWISLIVVFVVLFAILVIVDGSNGGGRFR